MPVKPAYWIELDSMIGEIPTNEYGEPKCSIVFGVIYKSIYYLTRLHTWKIRKIENIEPVDSDNHDHNSEENELIRSGSSLPWSSVNNCTGDIQG